MKMMFLLFSIIFLSNCSFNSNSKYWTEGTIKKKKMNDKIKNIVNKSNNNARQIYSKVSSINIWESDYFGLQLDIGGRGLSPNRSSNFKVNFVSYLF